MLNTSNDQRKLLPNFEQLFATTAQAPGGVARLRELILTLAVQGKLVPQDPSDEPASELLKKIRAEKDRLIAEGKIKKDKPLPAITEDEKPFELPVGWEWVRVFDLNAEFQNGASSRGDSGGKLITVIRLADVKNKILNFNDVRKIPISENDVEKYSIRTGDILITRVNGSADIVGQFNICLENVEAIYCDHFIRMRISKDIVSSDFLFFIGQSYLIRQRIKDLFITTAGQKTVNQGHIGSLLFPLPPLAEQFRIVARVEALMRLCDALEEKGRLEHTQHQQLLQAMLDSLTQTTDARDLARHWQRLAQHFDLLIDRPEAVDALEQTILQLAVRGLLVPQDPSDEPASELLKKIRAEKDRLIAEGKIKRDKRSKNNHDFLEPFPLPSGWEWATFPELGEFGRGKSKHRPRNDPQLFNPPIYPLVQTGEVARAHGIIQEFHSKYSEFGLAQSRLWPKGTLCITIAANIADAAILGFDACFPDSVVGFIPYAEKETVKYFLAFMETAKAEISAYAPATAQKNINLEILEAIKIPIPPLAEQSRIVARVTELRALCQQLREKLTQARTIQTQLAQAWVEQVAG